MITVALIEDNRVVREGIVALLEPLPDVTVVAAMSSAGSERICEIDPQVILLDIGLRECNSLRVVERVKSQRPEARVIVMDLLPVQEDIVEFIHSGVSAFITKDASVDDLVATIRLVATGTDVLPPAMTSTLFSQIARAAVARGQPRVVNAVRMTPREREVTLLIGEGLSNKEIAARLHIATHTVKSHVHNILEKLALHTRLQIAAYTHDTDPPG